MDVTSSTSLSALVNSQQAQLQPQQPAPAAKTSEPSPQDSTVVKISAQAQQLSRAENQNIENNVQNKNQAKEQSNVQSNQHSEQASESKPKEAAEPSGIQLVEGETKGGRVSTYA